MISFLRSLFGKERVGEPEQGAPSGVDSPPPSESSELRSVPGALVVRSQGGQVIYNLLTPHMQQFMGRCVGALKKNGVRARGTAQFSILLGETSVEFPLDRYYQPTDDPAQVEEVVAAARELLRRS